MNSLQFKEVSTRGRVAYGICCLENALNFYGYRQNEWQLLISELWLFCSQNMAMWHERIVELKPAVVCEEVEFSIKEYEYFSKETHDKFVLLYKESNKVVKDIIGFIHSIGITNLYVTIDTEHLKLASLGSMQGMLDLMNENNIPLPSISPFEKFPITGNHGWGIDFTKEDLIKAGL